MQRYAIVALILCFSCLSGRTKAQPVYTYQQLSKTYYAAQKDSLKKAWVCPDLNSTKAIQKIYREIWDSRTKTNYIIIDDEDNTYVYNVNGRKVMRTIQHKDGRIKTRISPAKEGHIMVAEYNSKEKYTRLSIEAL